MLHHRRRRGHTKPQSFCKEIKERKERKKKIVLVEFFFSRGGEKGLEVSVENSKAANKSTYTSASTHKKRESGTTTL